MGLDDVFGFSTSSYRAKISDRNSYSDNELANNIYKKRQQCSGSAFGVGAGLAMAAHTGGASLAGVAFSGRNRSIAKQKLEMLEHEWQNRGYDSLDKRLRDTIVPCAIGAAAMGVTAGVACGIEHAGSSAISNAATTYQPYAYTSTVMVATPAGYAPYTYTGYGVEQYTANVAGQMSALHAGSSVVSHGTGMGAKKLVEDNWRRDNGYDGETKESSRPRAYEDTYAPRRRDNYYDSDAWDSPNMRRTREDIYAERSRRRSSYRPRSMYMSREDYSSY